MPYRWITDMTRPLRENTKEYSYDLSMGNDFYNKAKISK